MTWNEFKKLIDDQLKKKKITPDTRLWHIDVCRPDKPGEGPDNPKVVKTEYGLEIT